MIYPNKLIRTNRRTLSLVIDKLGNLIVSAPKKLSNDRIYAFIKEKETWIERKQNECRDKINANENILEYKRYMYLGEEYGKFSAGGIKKIELFNKMFMMPEYPNISSEVSAMKKWYGKATLDIVKHRVEYFSNLMDLDYEDIAICNTKLKWASCSRHGNLKFNLRIVMLPPKVIDYIVVHELSHLVEFNHSKKFYMVIESIMPDYKRQINNLKDYSYLLSLFR